LKKNLNISLIIASIATILLIGFLILGIIAVQDKYEPEPNDYKIDVIKNNQTESKIKNNLIEFLENPINLLDFKKKKEMLFTTSVTNGNEYYFNPKINDSIFYAYNYPDFKKESNKINQFVVFKHGKNKHSYEDQAETLIEFRIFNPDSDLGKANLYGLTKTELESKFGTIYLNFENGIAYSYKNKVLTIELNNSKVKSFRYIKLNTENIDQDLIRQIVE
jgi:hypothetical protein